MIKVFASGAGLALLLAAPVQAQQPTVVDARVAETQRGAFAPPLCPLQKDSRLNNIERGLKDAAEQQAPERRARGLADAQRLLAEVLGSNANSGPAWYYLGRYYLALGDMAGLDSAWTRAQALLPDCDVDITAYRQNAWATLTNAGIELQNAGSLDSAKVVYVRATHAYRGLPHAYMNLGVLYANEGRNDSAAVFFASAVESTEGDSTMVEERKALLLNLGTIYQRLDDHRRALNTFGEYAKAAPEDDNILQQLSISYRALGMADSAEAVEARIVAALSQMNMDDLNAQELLQVGVGLFQAEKFAEAAEAFRRSAAKNPHDRDALFNLANTYLALEDGTRLLTTALLLREIEPLNEDVLRLQGQALRQIGGRDDELITVAETLVGLPVAVEVSNVAYTATEGRIIGTVTGRAALTPAGQPIPAAPVSLVFEFVNGQGAVIGTQTVNVPALTEGQVFELSVAAPVTREVAGWRYRKG